MAHALQKEKDLKEIESQNRKFDPVYRYMSEVRRYKLLTREKERELALAVFEEDSRDAAYILVTSNLRLVIKIALTYQRAWSQQNLLDLIQEGNMGLIHAVYKFDPHKQVRLSYYASFWIKAYILKFVMDNWSLVKIGTTSAQRKLFFSLKKEKEILRSQGFTPKVQFISERMGISEEEIISMSQRLDARDLSLNAPINDESDNERLDFITHYDDGLQEAVENKERIFLLHQKVAKFKKQLTERERGILEMRIFTDNPMTLKELGKRYGISRERVRQVENYIIKNLKTFFVQEIDDFDSYDPARGASWSA